MKRILRIFIVLIFLGTASEAISQKTIFELFKNDLELAEEASHQKNYQLAVDLYSKAQKKNSPAVLLKIAQCYYFLKRYDQAVLIYDKLLETADELPSQDIYYYAEAQTGVANYKKAIEYYKKYLTFSTNKELVYQKIWRLSNVSFLYEDSVYYALRPVSVNSGYGELCAVPYEEGIVFMSNRKEVDWRQQIDPVTGAPFYRLYYAQADKDSVVRGEDTPYNQPVVFNHNFNHRFHTGPIDFFGNFRKMVFVTTAGESGTDGTRRLKLFFADKKNGKWEVAAEFPYNSNHYSISDPSISEDGKLLFFSSDMEGGVGGKDIYKSTFENGQWTKPLNMGESINTVFDEVFPYIHSNQSLYFSSNGHAGLGGLDIFKTAIHKDYPGEVENVGYPLNSNGDDFGIIIDSLNTHGYITSNRKGGGYNDDIYQFDMDIQTYPIEVNCVIKYVEHSWADSSELKILRNVDLSLVDYLRNVTVAKTSSDNTGNFTITVPYFSKYKLKIKGKDIGESIASFEVPKYKKSNNKYEIVVVKDDFRTNETPDLND